MSAAKGRINQFILSSTALYFTLGAILVASLLGLAGCGEDDLACNSKATQNLVIQIAQKKMAQVFGGRGAAGDANLKAIKYNLSDIRTTDQTPRKNSCAANFIMDNPKDHQEFTVNYTAERTDEGRLYVTLLDF